MELEALFNAVIVKPFESEETTYGNIIVPDLGKETLKVGDRVVLPTMGFTKLPYNGEEYYVGPENQVLAKVNKSEDFSEVLNETLENISQEEINQIKDISNE
mgnify:CR=1 FL=1